MPIARFVGFVLYYILLCIFWTRGTVDDASQRILLDTLFNSACLALAHLHLNATVLHVGLNNCTSTYN